jgi:hypothetical protein
LTHIGSVTGQALSTVLSVGDGLGAREEGTTSIVLIAVQPVKTILVSTDKDRNVISE